MTISAKRGFRAFLYASWLLIGATFADAANLDDLIVTGIVVHDEADVGSFASHQLPQKQHSSSTKQGGDTAAPARISVDQDSPSLAADADGPSLVSRLISSDHFAFSTASPFFPEALHIKYRTLII